MNEYDSPGIGFIACGTGACFGVWQNNIAAGAFMFCAIVAVSLVVAWVVHAVRDETE